MSVTIDPEATQLGPEQHRDLLATMCVIRSFEERAIQLYNEGLIRGAIHSSAGQEAAAVGACSALTKADYLATTHRGHGHAIAKGARVDRLLAELMGRSDGFCSGKGGSMHVADLAVGMLGANGIVGASAELATGAAFAARVKHTDQVAVAVLGDGGMAEGAVHEAMNLAGLWKLPVIFFCENNHYAVTLPVTASVAAESIGDLAAAHGLPAEQVDGMDVLAVRESMARAVHRARAGEGASFIEAVTYRFMGHSRGDPNFGPYRSKEEWTEWQGRDPIPRFAAEAGLTGELDDFRARAEAAMEEASMFAQRSPNPPLSSAFDHVFPSGLAYHAQAEDGAG
ncbi:MAG: acoA [Chthonomonadaceae bacterium]|nr:acoA [Chthonomonadaceae bacterium]